MSGSAGPGVYLGVALDAAGGPVGMLMGYAAAMAIEGGVQAHAAFLHEKTAGGAVPALLADFEAWSAERNVSRLRVDPTVAIALPPLGGYRQISATYVKDID